MLLSRGGGGLLSAPLASTAAAAGIRIWSHRRLSTRTANSHQCDVCVVGGRKGHYKERHFGMHMAKD